MNSLLSAREPASPLPAVKTCLWLIRHAEVEPAYHGVFGGRIDMNLSERGHVQAAALADYLRSRKFDAFYASPMKRVQQTLAPIMSMGYQPIRMEGLREVDFGDWTGLAFHQVYARYQRRASEWLDQIECAGIPQGECGATFRARVAPCLDSILAKSHSGNVGVLCHGGVIRMLLSIILELPLPKTARFEVEYASITKVSWEEGRPELQLLNFAPWRDLA